MTIEIRRRYGVRPPAPDYVVYSRAANILEKDGWVRDSFHSPQGHCLVGAMTVSEFVQVHHYKPFAWQVAGSQYMELDHARVIDKYMKRYFYYRLIRWWQQDNICTNEHGGLQRCLILWNDTSLFSRKKRLHAIFRSIATEQEVLFLAEKAEQDRIPAIQERSEIQRLEDEIIQLKLRIEVLERENTHLRKRLFNYLSGNTVVKEQKVLENLTRELSKLGT